VWSVQRRDRGEGACSVKCGLEEGLSVHLKVPSKCCSFSPFFKNIILNREADGLFHGHIVSFVFP
jgi:hypothetical protein